MMAPKVIFEGTSFLVLAKPAGWVVNRAETTKGQETIQDWLEANFQFSIFNFKNCRSGVVHRLDKETSGLLLIAKTPEAFTNLQKQFKERLVVKRYLTLVHGQIQPEEGEITAAIARSPFNRKKFGVFLGGRESVTNYKVISYQLSVIGGKKQDFSLVEVTPKTGRTHQIRVHFKYIGHPVVGDEVYGGRKAARSDRQWCGRQFLHASYLAFFNPETGEKVAFTSPLPEDLAAVMKNF